MSVESGTALIFSRRENRYGNRLAETSWEEVKVKANKVVLVLN
jgi:hypothetical protein